MSSRIIDQVDSHPIAPICWPEHFRATPSAPLVERPHPTQKPDDSIVEARVEQAARAAREEGYRQGEAAGIARARQELQPVRDNLAASIAEIAALKPRLRHEVERQAVDLSLAIARRILRRQINIDPGVVEGLVRAALDSVSTREVTEVRVDPAHHRAIAESLESLGVPRSVHVVADAALEPGAVIIETSRGRLDASVSVQLEEIERGFADLLESERPRS